MYTYIYVYTYICIYVYTHINVRIHEPHTRTPKRRSCALRALLRWVRSLLPARVIWRRSIQVPVPATAAAALRDAFAALEVFFFFFFINLEPRIE